MAKYLNISVCQYDCGGGGKGLCFLGKRCMDIVDHLRRKDSVFLELLPSSNGWLLREHRLTAQIRFQNFFVPNFSRLSRSCNSFDDEPRARYAADVRAQGAVRVADTNHCGGLLWPDCNAGDFIHY